MRVTVFHHFVRPFLTLLLLCLIIGSIGAVENPQYARAYSEDSHVTSAEELILNANHLELKTKESFALKATLLSSDTSPNILWSSSDESIASVDSTGVVTAHRYGGVMITAETEDHRFEASCVVQTRFYDVAGSNIKGEPNYQYYYNAVYWAAANGITVGYDEGVYFGPERNCTRQEMLIFLWRMIGRPEVDADARDFFNDMTAAPETASNKSVAWAYLSGITKGYNDGGFHPSANITRLETMILLYRIAGTPDVEGKIKFSDCQNLVPSTDSFKSVLWGSQNGITSGYPDGTFGIKNNCLREAIVTFLYRYKLNIIDRWE